MGSDGGFCCEKNTAPNETQFILKSFPIKEEPIKDTYDHNDVPEIRNETIQIKSKPIDQFEENMGEEGNELPPAMSTYIFGCKQSQNDVTGFPDRQEIPNYHLFLEPRPTQYLDQLKIQFAAVLKLMPKNATPILCESLSKIELSYIEKCKAIVDMRQTLVCACHNVLHRTLSGLLSHLRALRIWFPVFTCYNCMITFPNRSAFLRHAKRCPCRLLETITKLSNLRKRSDVKKRLYQNFKCTVCKMVFSFHEDFRRHIDDKHLSLTSPFHCQCSEVFDSIEDYQDHFYESCSVNYHCDICFTTTKTLDDFQMHATNVHDNSEGFILLQDDDNQVPKHDKQGEDGIILTGKVEDRGFVKAPVTDIAYEPTVRIANPILLPSKSMKEKCPVHLKKLQMAELQKEALYSCPDDGWKHDFAENYYICMECGKSFKFQTELEQHRRVHLNMKVLQNSKTLSCKSIGISARSDKLKLEYEE